MAEVHLHQIITKMQALVARGDAVAIAPLLGPDLTFLPPAYWEA